MTRFLILITAILVSLYSAIAQSETGARKRILLLDTSPCCTEQHWSMGTDEFLKEIASVGAEVNMAEDTHVELIDHRDRLLDAHRKHPSNVNVVVRLVKKGTDGTAYVLLWNRRQQPVLRSLRFEHIDRPENLSTAILQVVEVVIAALADIPQPSVKAPQKSPQQRQETAAQATTPAPAVDSEKKWGMGLAFNGFWSPGGVGPQAGPSLLLDIMPSPRWKLMLEGVWIPIVSDISENGQDASIDMAIIRGYAYVAASLPQRVSPPKVQPFFGVGGGAAVAWTKQLHTDTVVRSKKWVTYLGVSILTDITLHPHFNISFGVTAGMLAPKFDIQFDEHNVAHHGLPLLEATVRTTATW